MGPVIGIVQSSALAGLLVAQVSGGAPAWDGLVQRGVELRLAGDEAQALVVFREAERAARTPRLLAQMALAEQSLGHWRDAEAHLLEALASRSDAWIVKQRDALDTALVTIRRHLGSLELLGGAGADVFVDGRPEGKLPRERPLRLEVGRHRVEIRSESAFPFARDVEIASDTTARETVELSPLPHEPDAGKREREAAGTTAPVVARAPTQAGSHPWLGWTLIGGGAGIAVFGVASLLASNGRARDYNGDPTCTGRADEPASCAAAATASRGWRIASGASFAAGGALVTAGVVVLLWRSSAAPVRVQLAPGKGGAQLDLSRSF